MSAVLKVEVKLTSANHTPMQNTLYYSLGELVTDYSEFDQLANDFHDAFLAQAGGLYVAALPHVTQLSSIRYALVHPELDELAGINSELTVTGLNGAVITLGDDLDGAGYVALLRVFGSPATEGEIRYATVPMRTSRLSYGPIGSTSIGERRLLVGEHIPTSSRWQNVRDAITLSFPGLGPRNLTASPVRVSHTPEDSPSGLTYRSRIVSTIAVAEKAFLLKSRFNRN